MLCLRAAEYTQINIQLDVAANATQFTYSNNEWRRITAGFNLLLDRKNDEMTGDNFYGLEVGSTEEVPMSDGIQDVVSFAGGEICHKWRKNWLQVWNWWDKEWK